MTPELIDRKRLKEETRRLLDGAQVSPRSMTALYSGLLLLLSVISMLADGHGILSTFAGILTSLISVLLGAGFAMYCMAIRRGERAEYQTLLDGFSFVGKLIALTVITYFYVWLWSMLFVIPGIVAMYRYRFAPFNLYENPGISPLEALEMSKRQTMGYKGQLFALDLSYLGWMVLASLPSLVESSLVGYRTVTTYYDAYVSGMTDLPAVSAPFLPEWGWVLLCGLWSLGVSLFYLAQFQCVELGYFETAKRTSGIGADVQPLTPDSL